MKITLSIIKADIGSVGGHIVPSQELFSVVKDYVESSSADIEDTFFSSTGDDIVLLITHRHGLLDEGIHKLAWDAFLEGTRKAEQQGLYGAGQDLLKDAFSGNVKRMGPAVAEMKIEERRNEPFLMFAADKTDPPEEQEAAFSSAISPYGYISGSACTLVTPLGVASTTVKR